VLRAADSSTKVSKPVLFRPKVPDFRGVHKRKIHDLGGIQECAAGGCHGGDSPAARRPVDHERLAEA